MRKSVTLCGFAALGAVVLGGQIHLDRAAEADVRSTPLGGNSGADVAVCELGATQSWGRIGDIHAFSIQTDAVNLGDETLLWQQNTNLHPTIGQNLYRYRDGRIEMIGMSWLKHGFCALHLDGCGDCQFAGGCPEFLNPGCRDPYFASLNGQQARLGPRSEVNASTGVFPYPYGIAFQETGDAIFKRLQVHHDDLDPALNQGATYYIEGHYVHQQEGTTDKRHNNATYEQVNPTPSGNTFSLGTGTNTSNLQPAIYAWREHVPEVVIEIVDIPGEPVDGRYHLAYHVYDNGDGTWRYEYAIHNMNSHRSARAFSVPLGPGVNVLDTYYHDVWYHSGEVYDDTPWEESVSTDSILWAGETYEENENANALRWSSTFNFSVTTDQPPMMSEVELTLFRPGTPDSVTVPALVPTPEETVCTGDLTGSGSVDVFDMLALLDAWGPCPDCAADLTGDDVVDVFDLLALLDNWGACD